MECLEVSLNGPLGNNQDRNSFIVPQITIVKNKQYNKKIIIRIYSYIHTNTILYNMNM